jgi:hypothetical protein
VNDRSRSRRPGINQNQRRENQFHAHLHRDTPQHHREIDKRMSDYPQHRQLGMNQECKTRYIGCQEKMQENMKIGKPGRFGSAAVNQKALIDITPD